MLTIWMGNIGINLKCDKQGYIEKLKNRFASYIGEMEGGVTIEIVETDFKPEITKKTEKYIWFTMFSEEVYVYIDKESFCGKIYIYQDIGVRYDVLDITISMILAQIAPYYHSVLLHCSCLEVDGKTVCFVGNSGAGKTTICKMFSSNSKILAEDMVLLQCLPNRIDVVTVPIAQKQFWVEKKEQKKLDFIYFIEKGELNIEKLNKEDFMECIIKNQFFLNISDQGLAIELCNKCFNRIWKNVSCNKLNYYPEEFYNKNRVYMEKIIEYITNNMKVDSIIDEKIDCLQSVYVPQNIMMRYDEGKKRYEVWDTKLHRLYGLDKAASEILVKIQAGELVYENICSDKKDASLTILNKFLDIGICKMK